MNAASAPEPKAPESIGWYIELTKWLIGISSGVLVFGFEKIHLSDLPPALELMFGFSALLLTLSIGVGILCCLQFLGYANRKESGPAPGEDAAAVQGYRTRGTLFYQLCAASLWVGILLFAVVWGIAVMTGHKIEDATSSPVLVRLPDTPSALLIDPASKKREPQVLVHDKAGNYHWQAVGIPLQP